MLDTGCDCALDYGITIVIKLCAVQMTVRVNHC
jgi:hypothetical protein